MICSFTSILIGETHTGWKKTLSHGQNVTLRPKRTAVLLPYFPTTRLPYTLERKTTLEILRVPGTHGHVFVFFRIPEQGGGRTRNERAGEDRRKGGKE